MHDIESVVTDAGADQVIPGGDEVHSTTWLNLNSGIAKNLIADTGDKFVDDVNNLIITDTALTNVQTETSNYTFADNIGDTVVETTLDQAGNVVVDGFGEPIGAEIIMAFAKNGMITDGQGLMGSATEQALFIKGVV